MWYVYFLELSNGDIYVGSTKMTLGAGFRRMKPVTSRSRTVR